MYGSLQRREKLKSLYIKARDADAWERRFEVYKEEKRNVKRCIYQSKEEVQEQFRRKMNEELNGNRKFLLEKGE